MQSITIPRTVTIVICICTYKRPQMLTRCFLSLIKQVVLPTWKLVFVIVDNEAQQENKLLVDGFQQLTNYPVCYVHQPRRGIACARNSAICVALNYQSDWLCFFDDDQSVAEDALLKAFNAGLAAHADVVRMFVNYVSAVNAPVMIIATTSTSKDIRKVYTSTSGGVLFRSFLVTTEGLGLRFDEKFSLSLGEDIDFFDRAFQQGIKIIIAYKALVYEEVCAERKTWGYQSARSYSEAAFEIKYSVQRKKWSDVRKYIIQALIRCIRLIEVVLLPFYYMVSYDFFKHRAHKLNHKLFRSLGILTGCFFKLDFYKKTSGY